MENSDFALDRPVDAAACDSGGCDTRDVSRGIGVGALCRNAVDGAPVFRARRQIRRRGGRGARPAARRLSGAGRRHLRARNQTRFAAHGAGGAGAAGHGPGGLRNPRFSLGLRDHLADVRRRLLARERGRACPNHPFPSRHSLGSRPHRPRADRSVSTQTEGHRLGYGGRQGWRAGRHPGEGHPASGGRRGVRSESRRCRRDQIRLPV